MSHRDFLLLSIGALCGSICATAITWLLIRSFG